MGEIEKNLDELERFLSKTKKYYDYDDDEYRVIKDIEGLFDLSIGEDYYKPIITKGTFNNNYIQYESRGDKNKILTVDEYLDIIKPRLEDIINDHKTQGERKIQLTTKLNLISSKPDSDETRTMCTKSDNIEIMISRETDEIIEDIFKSLRKRYQEGIEESMYASHFTVVSVDAMYYDLNKVSLSRGESYIDSPEWLKNKKSTINPKNNDDKCFQYALTVTLNHKQIKKDPQRISKIKPFIDQYNWKKVDFPTSLNSWKKFESNNKLIALSILYVPYNTKKIRHAYK